MVQDTLHREAGAVFEDASEMPAHYGDVLSEYQAVTTGVGVRDCSDRGKVCLTGKDRTRFLHGMVTNTVTGLDEWQGNHSAITTAQGQTLLDLWVQNLSDQLWLETEAGYQTPLFEALDKYLIADDVTMADETRNWSIFSVVGPQADRLMNDLGISGDDLAVHQTMQTQWNGHNVFVTKRNDWHLGGYDVRVGADDAPATWTALVSGGATPFGTAVRDLLDVENGVARSGFEIDERVTPLEVGLADAVDFNKGCYIGQEVIAKMHFRGKPRRYLVGILLEGDGGVESGLDVVVDGKSVGRVTRSVRSVAANGIMALGVIRRGMHEPGQGVHIGDVSGQIVALPYVKKN